MSQPPKGGPALDDENNNEPAPKRGPALDDEKKKEKRAGPQNRGQHLLTKTKKIT